MAQCSGSAAEPDVATEHIAPASLGQACESSPGNVQATRAASSSAGSAVQLLSDINTFANWQVQFPPGWHDLPPEASCAIEAGRRRGENVATYEQCRSKKQGRWDTYQMD